MVHLASILSNFLLLPLAASRLYGAPTRLYESPASDAGDDLYKDPDPEHSPVSAPFYEGPVEDFPEELELSCGRGEEECEITTQFRIDPEVTCTEGAHKSSKVKTWTTKELSEPFIWKTVLVETTESVQWGDEVRVRNATPINQVKKVGTITQVQQGLEISATVSSTFTQEVSASIEAAIPGFGAANAESTSTIEVGGSVTGSTELHKFETKKSETTITCGANVCTVHKAGISVIKTNYEVQEAQIETVTFWKTGCSLCTHGSDIIHICSPPINMGSRQYHIIVPPPEFTVEETKGVAVESIYTVPLSQCPV